MTDENFGSSDNDQPVAEKADEWETRPGLLSEEEIRQLSAEKGMPEMGAARADQTSPPGPNASDSSGEGGRSGEKPRHVHKKVPPIPPEEWTKYDWS